MLAGLHWLRHSMILTIRITKKMMEYENSIDYAYDNFTLLYGNAPGPNTD
jgi:hypothetical protein